MNAQTQPLISRANTLVTEAVAKGGRRRRYPPELKKIVRSLALKHKLSAVQIASSIPISGASARKWSRASEKSPAFRTITIKEGTQNSNKSLLSITVALALLTLSQALTLAWNLFHR